MFVAGLQDPRRILELSEGKRESHIDGGNWLNSALQ